MTSRTRKTVQFGPYTVGEGHPVRVVAEIGVNHLGCLDRAKELVHAAHEAGADAIKLQTYISEERYDRDNNPKADKFIRMLTDWELDREQETELWEYAKGLGAVVFTSPFDAASADFAAEMGSVAFKLAAFEIVNLDLVRAVAKHGKPVVFSRGMASLEEITKCVEILEEHGCECIILHCISSYPTPMPDSNIRMIHTLRERFDWPIGHSDHTRGANVPPLAVAAGAVMIEKHFTTSPKRRESDHPFAITPYELREIIFRVRQVETLLGRGDISKIDAESYMWDFRRKSA